MAGIGPVASPPASCSMVHITTPLYGSPEEDPFLLLESSLRCIEHILRCHVNQPLRRSWIEHPYGEEEIALLEELIAIEQLRCRLPADGDGACPEGIQGQVSAASTNSAFGRNSA